MTRENLIHNFLIAAFAIGLIFYPAILVRAASGDLDTTFGTGGKVVTDTAYDENEITGMTIQADGKIVVVGASYMISPAETKSLLARYNKDGSIDLSFGISGIVHDAHGALQSYGRSVAIQSDKKIVLAGFYWDPAGCPGMRAWIVRYNDDGSRDLTFGGGDGEVDFFIDCAFGSATTFLTQVGIQTNSKIVLSGYAKNGTSNYDFMAARLNTDGSLDTSFSFDGLATFAIGNGKDLALSLSIQPSTGKIVLAGYSYQSATDNDFALVRLNSNGALDSSFGTLGKVITDTGGDDRARAVVFQPNGKIVAAGLQTSAATFMDFSLARYNSNGTLDTTFGTGGKVVTAFGGDSDYISGISLQANGNIVAAGKGRLWGEPNHNFALARYKTDGSLDTSFSGDGKQTTDLIGGYNDCGSAVAIQADGKIVVAGYAANPLYSDIALARYLP